MSIFNCNVVQDILPLYADDVICDDTKVLVEEHLQECDICRRELSGMRDRITIPIRTDEVKTFKKLKRKWNNRQIVKGAFAALLFVALIFGVFFYIYIVGIPVNAEDLMIRTGLQCVPDYDENWNRKDVSCPSDIQSWIVDIGVHNGDVRTRSEGVWEMNGSSERVIEGVVIYVRWSPFNFPWDRWSSDWVENGPVKYVRQGVASSDMELDPCTDDFTVTIVCADQEITYSMKDVGLFNSVAEHTPEFCPWAR